ncbi:MAG: histidine phosphatase family protein [Chloroflexota bacterium]
MADPARLTGLSGSLVLVRHGETTWITEGRFQGRGDPPLSALGELQAVRVGLRLADPAATPALPLPDDAPIAIRHSPLQRAAFVAARVADGWPGTPVMVDADLAELDQGAWEGLTGHEVNARYATELAAWRRDPVHHHAPGGESLQEASVRAGRAAERLLDALRVAVEAVPPPAVPRPPTGHVLGYARPGADGEPWPWLVAVAHDGLLRLVLLDLLGVSLDAYWSFPFALCGVTIVEVRAGVARLRAHNLADHLDGLVPEAPPGLPGR